MTEGRSENLKKIRVLIVDDSATLREGLTTLCSLLSELEVVGTAGDGVEALDAIRTLKPDVVSLDIRMPKMSGIEVLKVIKRDQLTCTPIVLSGLADEVFREKCLELGAKYVFDKGTELEKFLQVLGGSHQFRRKIPATATPCARKRAGSAGKLRRKPMDKGRQMI
jgi:two-component system NarL family response regulator